MLKCLLILSFFLFYIKCEDVTSDEKWDDFKIKWTLPGKGGFLDQPKTQTEAEKKDWKEVSDGKRGCSGTPKYPGFHFIPPKENPEFTLIYDKNGFIAGMQSLVSKTADTSHYDFKTVDWYDEDEIEGDAVYLATVYFIKPELICSHGRSKEEFEDQGTGNVLWLQKKDRTFLKAPLEMDDADEGCFWKRHKCFLNMGTHYLNLDYGDDDFDCRRGIPIQLLYIDDNLNGFIWTHIAPLPLKGTDWELTDLKAIAVNIRDPASCIKELAKNEIPRTMHVFFRDNEISYNECEKLNKKDPPTSCKDSEESDESNGKNQGNTKESDENDETDDGEDSDENNATGQQSISVGIMFALTWLVIYNI